jgi:Uma2 family endonuclease
VFRDASWRLYKAMLREFDEQPSRVNYDRGTLEIMTLSVEHEHLKTVVGMMVGLLAVTLRLKVMHGGSSTLKRLSKLRGLEADQCYWVANEQVMRGKKRIDLRTDPPPDLVIEVDVMHAAVNREKIYASLGVPEMWVLRRRGGGEVPTLAAFALDGRTWVPIDRSRSFPFLRVADLDAFVARSVLTTTRASCPTSRRGCRPCPAAGARQWSTPSRSRRRQYPDHESHRVRSRRNREDGQTIRSPAGLLVTRLQVERVAYSSFSHSGSSGSGWPTAAGGSRFEPTAHPVRPPQACVA